MNVVLHGAVKGLIVILAVKHASAREEWCLSEQTQFNFVALP